jgi:hypothetical protein
MRTNLFNSVTLFLAFILLAVACGKDEPCEGNCPVGFICQNDQCVADPNFDACKGVVCPAGQECKNGKCQEIVFGENSVTGEISTNTTWKADKVHVLNGKVYVKEGVTLTIEPGTIVKGKEGLGSLASALIVARGAKLIAEGTADKPIIFTTVLDNIKPGQKSGTSLQEYDFGKWGGVIVLGYAPVSATNGDTLTQIEGIPGDLVFGKYGGNNVADNSGILKYVSIRHGGALIGDGNEINGLTLGGVGNGTVVENIEIVGNLDDGIELFGGSVNVKNIAVGFVGDDAIDVDQNYSGTIENFYIIHGRDNTDKALELDGPEGVKYTTGLFTIKNGTCVAADQVLTAGADLKAKCQGTLENISFVGYKKGKGISVRSSFTPANSCAEKSDAYTNLKNNKLVLKNLDFIATDYAIADVSRLYTDSGASDAAAQKACLEAVGATYETLLDTKYAETSKLSGSLTAGVNKSLFTWTYLSVNNKLK